jgi:hypothetical protein
MHFPSMSRNGQVATAGCNGQAFFKCEQVNCLEFVLNTINLYKFYFFTKLYDDALK